MAHDADFECLCVMEHNPNPMELHLHHILPLYLGGDDVPKNLIPLCPTSHANVHELLREWMKANGKPTWAVRHKFGPYIRFLAELGYTAWQERSQ